MTRSKRPDLVRDINTGVQSAHYRQDREADSPPADRICLL